jgi:hypothetical protein
MYCRPVPRFIALIGLELKVATLLSECYILYKEGKHFFPNIACDIHSFNALTSYKDSGLSQLALSHPLIRLILVN